MLYAVTANSAGALARSEFAEWVQRWHGRIANVGWRFFFRQFFTRINLLENLQIAKTRFLKLLKLHDFHGFLRLGISSIGWIKFAKILQFRKPIYLLEFFGIGNKFQRINSRIPPPKFCRILRINSPENSPNEPRSKFCQIISSKFPCKTLLRF